MNAADVRDWVYPRLQSDLGGAGFRLNKSKESFARRILGGRQFVVIALVDYEPVFELSAILEIRLDAAEAIVNRFSGVDPKDHASTVTVLTQLSALTAEADQRWRGDNDLPAAIDRFATAVARHAVPFLDRYQDVISIDQAMNVTPIRGFNSPQLPYSAMAEIAVAHLARNPAYGRVVADAVRACAGLQEGDQDKLRALVAYVEGLRAART